MATCTVFKEADRVPRSAFTQTGFSAWTKEHGGVNIGIDDFEGIPDAIRISPVRTSVSYMHYPSTPIPVDWPDVYNGIPIPPGDWHQYAMLIAPDPVQGINRAPDLIWAEDVWKWAYVTIYEVGPGGSYWRLYEFELEDNFFYQSGPRRPILQMSHLVDGQYVTEDWPNSDWPEYYDRQAITAGRIKGKFVAFPIRGRMMVFKKYEGGGEDADQSVS